jgi:hypothetical protein
MPLQDVVANQKGLRLPLRQRLLLILQQERLKIVSALHFLISKINPAINALAGGNGDVHAMNGTINAFAYDFGLPDQGAANDTTASLSYIDRIYRQFITGIKPQCLWDGVTHEWTRYEGYNSRLISAVQDQVGISWLPRPDITTWALDWIEKEPFYV